MRERWVNLRWFWLVFGRDTTTNQHVGGVRNIYSDALTDEQYEAIYHRPRPGSANGGPDAG